MTTEAFARRRNVWFALTIVAFVSPSFWIYALFALVLLAWAARRDENPLALFVLVTFTIPNVRLLHSRRSSSNQSSTSRSTASCRWRSWCRRSLRVRQRPGESGARRLRRDDVLLLAFLAAPGRAARCPTRRSPTRCGGRFLVGIDIFIVFYCVQPGWQTRERIDDVMACFWMACAVMAPIAHLRILEGLAALHRLASRWGDPNVFAWLFRGDTLRAQAAAGHSINLGYALADEPRLLSLPALAPRAPGSGDGRP